MEEEPFDMEGFWLDGAPEDFIRPLSLCLFEDAVVAMDGITYSRKSIQAHIDFCVEKGMPLTSPMTGEHGGDAGAECDGKEDGLEICAAEDDVGGEEGNRSRRRRRRRRRLEGGVK